MEFVNFMTTLITFSHLLVKINVKKLNNKNRTSSRTRRQKRLQ